MVKTSTDGTPVAVPSKFVADVTEKKAAEIGRKVGGTVASVKQKPVVKPTTPPPPGGSNAGVIAGVVVAIGLVVVIAAISVWYFRYESYAWVVSCAQNKSVPILAMRISLLFITGKESSFCELLIFCQSHHITAQITSHQISSRHLTPRHVTSRHIISYHIISYPILSYPIISYHIISYHIIS